MMSSRPLYPPASGGDEVETLHGESIPDPYRWLEQGDDPRTQAWTASQNALTESLLAAVPARARLRARLDELLSIGALSTPEPVAGRYFYQRRDGRQNQPVLYVREGREGELVVGAVGERFVVGCRGCRNTSATGPPEPARAVRP